MSTDSKENIEIAQSKSPIPTSKKRKQPEKTAKPSPAAGKGDRLYQLYRSLPRIFDIKAGSVEELNKRFHFIRDTIMGQNEIKTMQDYFEFVSNIKPNWIKLYEKWTKDNIYPVFHVIEGKVITMYD